VIHTLIFLLPCGSPALKAASDSDGTERHSSLAVTHDCGRGSRTTHRGIIIIGLFLALYMFNLIFSSYQSARFFVIVIYLGSPIFVAC
jgi:hypothetical protein